MKNEQLNYSFIKPLLLAGAFLIIASGCSNKPVSITSPDGAIEVLFEMGSNGDPGYSVYHSGDKVIERSSLGVVRSDEDFSQNLKLKSVTDQKPVTDSYSMLHGKQRNITYRGNEKRISLLSANGKNVNIIFRVSDDGVAFRYHFPENSEELFTITRELTSFNFDTSAVAYLQPSPDDRTGWEQTQPSYEEHYQGPVQVGASAPFDAGWVMPALFKSGKYWIALAEAAVGRTYCGSRLSRESPGGEYSLQFPQPGEGRNGEPVLPESTLPWQTPWRIAVVTDNLATLAESTLGTDLAEPAMYDVSDWMEPGLASWSWIMYKDGSIRYEMQKRYIDFAAEMNWGYCLVDVNWDRTIGYERIAELSDYAADKGVKLLLWYNSAGDWNSVTFYTPHSRLLTHESRAEEFGRLKDMGVGGIKVDFFAGDGQSMMNYYIDIMEDAAKYNLAVNFHGSTYPRGWSRTWPNLVTMESIRGEEFVTFNQDDADRQPFHSTVIPFTRNLFDPMDFTPVNFSGIPTYVTRRTTPAFEAALAVIFTSGIQHIAESPRGMADQPEFIREYMKEIPVLWDETRFIDGYPGKFVVMARRSGNKWYIAGINGEKNERTIEINTGFLTDSTNAGGGAGEEIMTASGDDIPGTGESQKIEGGVMIGDDDTGEQPVLKEISLSSPALQITMAPNGGFVVVASSGR